MIDYILSLLPDILKALAAVGFFAGISSYIKKAIKKRKALNDAKAKAKSDEQSMLIEVLEKVNLIEPRLNAIDIRLRRLSENQKVILNMQNISFFVFDNKGYCEYASPALCQLIKHPESRILKSGWLALLIERDIERIKKAWTFAIETSTVFDEIFTYRESNIKVHCIAFHKKDKDKFYDGSFAQLTEII